MCESGGMCSRVYRRLRGHNAPVDPEGEKAVPARSAPIRRKLQQAEQQGKCACAMLTRNTGQVHVAAHSAVDVCNVADGSRPRIEAQIACLAAPGTQPCQAGKIIVDTTPSRSAGAVALTVRTKQGSSLPGSSAREHRKRVTVAATSICIKVA